MCFFKQYLNLFVFLGIFKYLFQLQNTRVTPFLYNLYSKQHKISRPHSGGV